MSWDVRRIYLRIYLCVAGKPYLPVQVAVAVIKEDDVKCTLHPLSLFLCVCVCECARVIRAHFSHTLSLSFDICTSAQCLPLWRAMATSSWCFAPHIVMRMPIFIFLFDSYFAQRRRRSPSKSPWKALAFRFSFPFERANLPFLPITSYLSIGRGIPFTYSFSQVFGDLWGEMSSKVSFTFSLESREIASIDWSRPQFIAPPAHAECSLLLKKEKKANK